jgi:hypothetical protein
VDRRGDDLHAALAAEGVDLTYVIRDDRGPTGVALIHVDQKGQKQILAVLGANRRLTPADVERATNIIGSVRVLLAQLEVPVETVSAAVRLGWTSSLDETVRGYSRTLRRRIQRKRASTSSGTWHGESPLRLVTTGC